MSVSSGTRIDSKALTTVYPDPVKNLILSGPSAHLFFLYAPICDCLSTGQDGEVEVLVKRALKRMGHDMGLN